jgi:hypothetical protein
MKDQYILRTSFFAADIQYSFVDALLAVSPLSFAYVQRFSLETDGQTGKCLCCIIIVALYIPLIHVGKYLLNADRLTQVKRNMLLDVEVALSKLTWIL